jgi:hypothetical protein
MLWGSLALGTLAALWLVLWCGVAVVWLHGRWAARRVPDVMPVRRLQR